MGLGNGNAKTGDKGSNFKYELKSLQGLEQTIAVLATLATESTLVSVLNAIIAADQDLEILLVRDNGNGGIVVQQITNWETGVPVVSYRDVNGNPYIPVGPLEYLDPSAVLNLILTEILAQGITLDSILLDTTSIASEDFATQTTLAALLAELELKADLTETQPVSAAALPLPTGAATEVTLASVDTKLTPQVRTHNTVIAVGVGSVPAGSLSGSLLNQGNAVGIWNGASIPAGVSIPWAPIANRDTYGAIAYDATGTTFIIEYTT